MGTGFERRYAGLHRNEAQSEAIRLMQRSLSTGKWDDLPERLIALRRVMSYAPAPEVNPKEKDEEETGR